MVLENGSDYTAPQSQTYPYISPLNLNLSGKSVFITGASKGIGSAIAISYARAGASIIGLGSRSSQAELVATIQQAAMAASRPTPQVYTYTMDVTSESSVSQAAQQFTTDSHSQLDILINNAGYLSFSPILSSDPTSWWTNWQVNVLGVYLVTRAFLPLLLLHSSDDDSSSSSRTIINLSSAGAHTVRPGGSAYQTTKMAVCRFTEFLGQEHGDQGVLAYSVHPGAVLTDMGKAFQARTGFPMRDSPELCGDTLAFLTAEKRLWLQGRYLSCTWDMEEVMGRKEDIVRNDWLKIRMRIGLPSE